MEQDDAGAGEKTHTLRYDAVVVVVVVAVVIFVVVTFVIGDGDADDDAVDAGIVMKLAVAGAVVAAAAGIVFDVCSLSLGSSYYSGVGELGPEKDPV